MKRRTATVGLLGMAIVITLAAVGLVVGNWGQKLSINGNVSTGSVNSWIEAKITNDSDGNDPEDLKNLATCVSTSDGQKVTVTVTNAYPGYWCHFWTNVWNRGTVPIAVAGIPTNVDNGLTLVRAEDDASLPKGNCENPQVLPGQAEFCDWDVVVGKDVPQNGQLTFSISVCAGLAQADGTPIKGCLEP